MIEKGAFEDTHLKKLMIRGSLQYIGCRMCPSTMKLLLTKKPKRPKLDEWKASFIVNRNEVMGIRTGHEMEDGEDGEEGEDLEEGESTSRKCCAVW
jgi:hypothetical protein